jgi:hypothetical protein
MYIKKLKFTPTNFGHHRSGWHPIAQALHANLYNKDGIVFYDWADRIFKDNMTLTRPWTGLLHNVLTYPNEYPEKYSNRIYPLTELINQKHFLKSLDTCKGLFTLCETTAEFLRKSLNCTVCNLTHPITCFGTKFYWQEYLLAKKVVTVGQWLRKFHSICDLKTSQKKILIKTSGYDADYSEMLKYSNCSTIKIKEYLQNKEYDKILASSVVFLHLYDAAACNVILECIVRATPILINRLPATVEYLGESYPLFYDNLKEAEEKLNSSEAIKHAHLYLKNMSKDKLTIDYFIESFVNSEIYVNLGNNRTNT